MRRFNSRKFKYGASATLFTVAFIAVVVVFNVVFTALANKYSWYFDMTKDKVFTLSEDAEEMLSDINEDVNIYFAMEPDKLMGGEYSYLTRYVYQSALQMEEKFPNINVECVDVYKNPAFFRDFYNTAASQISATSVVVESGGEVRVLSLSAFFTADDPEDATTIWAYNGEKRFVSAIMQVTQTDSPKALFTTSHGEELENALALADLFDSNGFTVEKVDLASDSIDPDTRIIVIYNPIYDFVGAEAEDISKNEIEKLDEFLDNRGTLMVFADAEHADNLRNLADFLEEWGIKLHSGEVVRDNAHSMSTDGYSIITAYRSDTLGGSVYSDLNKLSTPPKAIIRRAMPLSITWLEGVSPDGSRQVSAVLSSYEGAELVVDGQVAETGQYDLFLMSRETRIVNSEEYYSYVFVAGSASFASRSYIESTAYSNEDIISAALKAAGRERVLAVLERKPLDDDDITVTTSEADSWTVAMTVVIPFITAICGLIVVTRRRHL